MARTKKEKNKHGFWKRLHFKYRLSVLNENTLEEVWRLQASIFMGTMLVLVFAITLITLTAIGIIATPIRNYLPGYSDAEVRSFALKNAILIDSLEIKLDQQTSYIENLHSVFQGKLEPDSSRSKDVIAISENDKSLEKSESERQFDEKYEKEEKYNLSAKSEETKTMTEGAVFFKPLKGVISAKYNPAISHYGIDLAAKPKESVVAVLEGAVIFSGYDPNVGYFIQLQHRNGFVSIYKNNDLILKKTGDQVRTGEVIAIIGSSSQEKTGPHLHFELWYKGMPVNPESYITF
ncbi:MAG: family peptidase [Bacteroidetes bacterium]|jgi:murein DD-endopeptidase MepM/ murein hydrolase activator NlpD|nr:family peptidase [Bacteroidota bacterium]